MPQPVFLGEFEQLVLLALLKVRSEPYALRLRDELNALAGRSVSRGALYRTLDRLEGKGFVQWDVEGGGRERRGHVRRRFRVTKQGIAMLRASRRTLLGLWSQVAEVLE
jgi:DNA-binding PadR family transcriptional regulator